MEGIVQVIWTKFKNSNKFLENLQNFKYFIEKAFGFKLKY